MSFDFSSWKGPRSIAQIKADHAAEDANARRAAEAAQISTATVTDMARQSAGVTPARNAA